MKKRKYWAGFCDNQIAETKEKYGDEYVLAIYLLKKDARKHYQDVRPVEIKEIRRPKRK